MTLSLRKVFFRLKQVFFSRYFLFPALLACYTEIMQHRGGLPSLLPAWRLELPFVAYLYFYLNLITRKNRWQPILTALPILLLYIASDIYNILFGRLPRLCEIEELPDLFRITPLWASALFTLPFLLLLLSLEPRRHFRAMLFGFLPLGAILLPMEFTPASFLTLFEQTQKEIIFYSELYSAKNNGRLGMMFYKEAKRRMFLDKLADYRDNPDFLKEFNAIADEVRQEKIKRNIHLVVLESFLDPNLFRKVRFSRDPISPEFKKLTKGGEGFSISPVFGGSTAQAEFEVLCGVPAMRELSGIEFDAFTGNRTFCLPQILNQGGYQTIATNSFYPDFFNSTSAYQGMGFSTAYYPLEYAMGRDTYFSKGDTKKEIYMFDGDLLVQNLQFITRKIKENPNQHFLNYILTIYGHTPYLINTRKRPEFIKIIGEYRSRQLERIANQYYYRTRAIAAFVKGLMEIDPAGLIILVSDHLPLFDGGPESYRKLNYLDDKKDAIHMNRIYFFENGRPVHYRTIRHFEVPSIILNIITEKKYCREHACGFTSRNIAVNDADYRDEYMAIMAHAMDDENAPVVAGSIPANKKNTKPVTGNRSSRIF